MQMHRLYRKTFDAILFNSSATCYDLLQNVGISYCYNVYLYVSNLGNNCLQMKFESISSPFSRAPHLPLFESFFNRTMERPSCCSFNYTTGIKK